MGAVASVEDLVKHYKMEEVVVPALLGVSLSFEEGDFIALMGPSGSGKSTLLNLLGCLDRSTTGRYYLGGEDVSRMEDDQLSEVRSRYIGFIFQSYNLLPQYTVVENIEIPLLYQGVRLNEATRQRCIDLAEMVGLGTRLDHRPTQLSGGQQQRVAIARALVNDPHVILADEPTGNLDSRTSEEIMRLLCKLNDAGKTIIMVTHEDDIAAWARRVVRMRDGRIETDVRNQKRHWVPASGDSPFAGALPAVLTARATQPFAPSEAPAEAPAEVLVAEAAPTALAAQVSTALTAAGSPAAANGQVPAGIEHARLEPLPSAALSSTGSFFSGMAIGWMKARSSFTLALRSLWLHKLRSFLSVLGIIIGTGAVITLMAFGKGSMEDALADIRRQGTTNVIAKSIKPADDSSSQKRSWVVSYGMTWDDYDRFKLITTVVGLVPMRVFPQDLRNVDRVFQNARLVATVEDYQRINQFEMAAGRFLRDSEDQTYEGDDSRFRTVIVLGAHVAEELFPFEEVIGKTVVMNKEQYQVIGVIKERVARGSSSQGQSAEDFNNDVYIPIRTCQARFGEKVVIRQGGSRTGEQVELHQVTLTVSDVDKVRSTGDVVRNLLARYHQKKDWEVQVPLDKLEAAERERARFTMLLWWIGSISLGVGGIGIMNIMLATVTERTREIGIRRALGAKRADITSQFIIEAVVQTSIGGLLGMAMGLVIVFGVPLLSRLIWNTVTPVQLDVSSIFLALSVAVGVGVVFGWYPAWRASRLDPIEALRHN